MRKYLKITIRDEKALFACAFSSRYEQMYDYEVCYVSRYFDIIKPEYVYAMLSLMYPKYDIKVRVTKHRKTYSANKPIFIESLECEVKHLFELYRDCFETFGTGSDVLKPTVHMFADIPFAIPIIKIKRLDGLKGFIEANGITQDINGYHTTFSSRQYIENNLDLHDLLEKVFKGILPRKGKYYDIVNKGNNRYQAYLDDEPTVFEVQLTRYK